MVTCLDNKDFSLEQSFEELEKMVAALEDENITLEDSFKLYKDGMELIEKCASSIDSVEKKVMVLNENGGLDEF